MLKSIVATLLASLLLSACGGGGDGGGDEEISRFCPDALTGAIATECSLTIDPTTSAKITIIIEAEVVAHNPGIDPATFSRLLLIHFAGDGYAFTPVAGEVASGQTLVSHAQLRQTLSGSATAYRPIIVGLSAYDQASDLQSTVRNIRISVLVEEPQ